MSATDEAVAALLRERLGYVHRGLDARVALVDAELKKLGYKPSRTSDPSPPAAPVEEAVEGPTETATKRGGPRPRD
jgi:hypothetical protein